MAGRKPAKKGTQMSAKSTSVIGKASKGFTDEERVAMRERVQELKAAAVTRRQSMDVPIANTVFALPAADEVVERTAKSLREHGFEVFVVDGPEAAHAKVLELIPERAEVHTGRSLTLETIGVNRALMDGKYDALRPRILSLDRAAQARDIRKLASAPDFMLGSAHAVTQDGHVLAASYTGSQLGPYVWGAGKVILVVGSQKIVSGVDAGLRRIYDYAYPLEDARAREAYGIPSAVNNVLIMSGAPTDAPGRVTVILLKQAIGF